MKFALYTTKDEVIVIEAASAAEALKKATKEGYQITAVIQISS